MAAENVRVAVRVRPLLPKEQEEELCVSTDDARGLLAVRKDVDGARTALLTPAKQRAAAARGNEEGTETLAFDHVWGAGSTQATVFAQVEPIIDCALEGYNSTVFAYGPSGSGKTHTMIGSAEDPGVVPRAVQRLLQLAKAQPEHMFVFVLSVLELHNDVFYDLLDDESGCASKKRRRTGGQSMPAKKIEVVRNGQSSQLRGDYTKMQIGDADTAMAAIEASLARRSTSGTGLNDRSSRSHAMVIIQAQQASIQRRMSSASVSDGGSSDNTTVGTLYMVDLAGSERIKLSHVQGEALQEAKHINTSLSALGKVLTALSSKKKGEIVPYRDSKLTLLLQDALGGNSKTMMITCINPKKDSYAYSSVALQYAVRAKHIKNSASINLDADKSSEIEELKREIHELRRRLQDRQTEFDTVSNAQAQDPGEHAIKMDKIKQLMLMHELEKQEHRTKFAHVINSSQDAYQRLETQVAAYCDKLLQAERASEMRQKRIEELEEHVQQERLDKANLHARQLQEAQDKKELENARQTLERRNLELERRVRELEAAASAARAVSASPQVVALLPSVTKEWQDSPYHHRNTPVARSQAEKEILESTFPGLKGRVLVASPAEASAAASPLWAPRDECGKVPASPGDVLVRNLDTGEELPAKQVLSRLSLNDRLLSAKKNLLSNSILSPLRKGLAAAAGPQSLRARGALNSARLGDTLGKARRAIARRSDVDTTATVAATAAASSSSSSSLQPRVCPTPAAAKREPSEMSEREGREGSCRKRLCRHSPSECPGDEDGKGEREQGRQQGVSLFSPTGIERAFQEIEKFPHGTSSGEQGRQQGVALFSPTRIERAFEEMEKSSHGTSSSDMCVAMGNMAVEMGHGRLPRVRTPGPGPPGLPESQLLGQEQHAQHLNVENQQPNAQRDASDKQAADNDKQAADNGELAYNAEAPEDGDKKRSSTSNVPSGFGSRHSLPSASTSGKRSSLPSSTPSNRAERMQEVIQSLSHARSETLARVKRLSAPLFSSLFHSESAP